VLSPIHLNYEFVFEADEVEDVITKWMLAAKFQTGNLATSQKMPQSLFRVGHVVPQSSLQLAPTYLLIRLADHNLPHPFPHPPLEGEGMV